MTFQHNKINPYITGYGCSTAAGPTLEETLAGLRAFRGCFERDEKGRRIARRPGGTLSGYLDEAFKDLRSRERLDWTQEPYGVLFASTKGWIEDFIWKQDPGEGLRTDPFTEPFESWLTSQGLQPYRMLTVSNACASGLSALLLARRWLQTLPIKNVLILGADLARCFVVEGFDRLGALSQKEVRPFSVQRDGLGLGEGAAAILLSSEPHSDLILEAVDCDLQGDSPTRPTHAVNGLVSLYERMMSGGSAKPDWVIAHATATQLNDAVESQTFQKLFGEEGPRITASKRILGHTLGASSLIDATLACEVLRQGQGFPIADQPWMEGCLPGHLAFGTIGVQARLNRVLVSSLGFGNIHALGMFQRLELG